MKKIFFILFILFMSIRANASVFVESFITPDDVTIDHLEDFRTTVVDAINNADGSLIQDGTIDANKLDADANPHNRWNEAFNDFVYTGLTIPTSASLTSTTTAGTAYINGVRVVKDATAKTYTASKWIYVDLSDSGVYTYQTTTIGSAEPSVSSNSIRLARVSTDSSTVLSVRDDRVTQINISAGSAGGIIDTDSDTKITTEISGNDEDILRFSLGNTTLSAAQEVMTLQAADSTHAKLEPTTTNFTDLGSTSKRFRNAYISGTLTATSSNQGDIFYDNGTNSFTRLTPATSGYFLKTNGTSSNPTWGFTGLGTAVSKSDNTSYQATTDGFFVGTLVAGGSAVYGSRIDVYSDGSNPPTTKISGCSININTGASAQSATANICSFMYPVKKNNYYKGVQTTDGTGSTPTVSYSFIPMGE